MNALATLLVCAGLTLALSASTLLVLRSSFLHVLVELCRSSNHGRFWFAFASVAIVLARDLCGRAREEVREVIEAPQC